MSHFRTAAGGQIAGLTPTRNDSQSFSSNRQRLLAQLEALAPGRRQDAAHQTDRELAMQIVALAGGDTSELSNRNDEYCVGYAFGCGTRPGALRGFRRDAQSPGTPADEDSARAAMIARYERAHITEQPAAAPARRSDAPAAPAVADEDAARQKLYAASANAWRTAAGKDEK